MRLVGKGSPIEIPETEPQRYYEVEEDELGCVNWCLLSQTRKAATSLHSSRLSMWIGNKEKLLSDLRGLWKT